MQADAFLKPEILILIWNGKFLSTYLHILVQRFVARWKISIANYFRSGSFSFFFLLLSFVALFFSVLLCFWLKFFGVFLCTRCWMLEILVVVVIMMLMLTTLSSCGTIRIDQHYPCRYLYCRCYHHHTDCIRMGERQPNRKKKCLDQ